MTQSTEKQIAVKVENLTKTFKIPLEASNGIKQKLINTLKGRKGYREFTPLNDISFEIEKGDFFGIVGRNGSGKSTLLKTIAGIYAPDEGLVQVNGKLVPFIELGVGFNPELTGRENVFLNGALLGFSRKEIEAMYDEIVEFAELGEFMEERLKNYSSGMQVRLAFSIAIRAESDVLLLDEVLAVGDAAFQAKCFEYFEELKNSDTTVIFISHDRASLEKFCSRGILIDNGEIIESGKMEDVIDAYSEIVLGQMSAKQNRKVAGEQEVLSQKQLVTLENIYLSNTGTSKKIINADFKDHLTVNVELAFKDDVERPIIGVTLWKKGLEGAAIYAANNLTEKKGELGVMKKGSRIKYSISLPQYINDGEYYLEVGVANSSATNYYLRNRSALDFRIFGSSNPHALVASSAKMEIKKL